MSVTASDQLKADFESRKASYVPMVWIEDDNGAWVDLTDYLENKGRDLAQRIGSVTHAVEKTVGRGGTSGTFLSSTSSLTFNNSSGFFTTLPLPSGLKTVDNSTPVFGTTITGTMINWANRKLRIVLKVYPTQGGSPEHLPMATVVIKDVSFQRKNQKVTFKLKSLAWKLQEGQAESVKDGRDWWEMVSRSALIKKLLATDFGDSSGVLPTTYNIPVALETPTADGSFRISSLGTPPEWDGTKWNQLRKIPEACVWGTVGSTTALWIGCGEELWYYQPSLDKYTKVGTTHANYHITRMWLNQATGWLHLLVTDAPVGKNFTQPDRNVLAYVYTYDGTTLSSNGSLGNYFPGLFSYRDCGTTTNLSGGAFIWGNHWSETGLSWIYRSGENLALPYRQWLDYEYAKDNSSLDMNPEIQLRSLQDWNQGDMVSTTGDDTVPAQDPLWQVLPTYAPKGYFEGFSTRNYGNSMTAPEMGLRFSEGQRGAVAFYPSQGTNGKGYILYTRFVDDTSTPYGKKYELYRWDVPATAAGSGSSVKIGDLPSYMGAASHAAEPDPMAMVATQILGTDYIFLYGVVRLDQDANLVSPPVESVQYGAYYSYSLGYLSGARWNANSGQSFLEAGAPYYVTGMSGLRFLTSTFFRQELNTGNPFGLEVQVGPDWMGSSYTIIRGPFPFYGITSAYTGTDDYSSARDVYFMEGGSGKLYKWTWPANGLPPYPAPQILSDGTIADFTDLYLATPTLALDEDTRAGSTILWGITSPTPNRYATHQEDEQNFTMGNWRLFKYDSYLADRVPLAEFSGMNKWQAISQLVAPTNHVGGFDANGDFFVVPRPETASPTYTIGSYSNGVNTTDLLVDLTETFGYTEIKNKITVTPYGTLLGEPSGEVLAKPRSDEEGSLDQVEVELTQDNRRKMAIELKCSQGGYVSSSREQSLDSPLFEFLQHDVSWSTSFGSAYTGGTTVTLSSGVESIARGDALKAHKTVGDSEVTATATVKTTPTDAQITLNQVEISSAFTDTFAQGDLIEVVEGSSGWSGEVGNFIENPVMEYSQGRDSTNFEFVGWTDHSSVLLTANTEDFINGRNSLQMQAFYTSGLSFGYVRQDVVVASNTLHSWSFWSKIVTQPGTTNTPPNDPGGVLSIAIYDIDNGASYALTSHSIQGRWTRLQGQFTTQASGTTRNVRVEIRIAVLRESHLGPVALLDNVSLSEGPISIEPFIHLGAYDAFYPLGESGAYIKFPGPRDENGVIQDAKLLWKEGDRVSLTFPGVELNQQDFNRVSVIRSTSISRYGEKELKVNNKFIYYTQAKDLATDIADALYEPHLELKVTTPLLPWLGILDENGAATQLKIVDPVMFSGFENNAVTGYPKKIVHNLSRGTSTFTLRTIEGI